MLIGYARVSTEDQNLDLQRDALTKAGCMKIFEKESGRAGTKRPAFEAALAYLRPRRGGGCSADQVRLIGSSGFLASSCIR